MEKLRNIVDTTLVPHSAFQEATERMEQCFRFSKGAAEPICIAVVGESRTGKSRAQEECCSRHEKVRSHDGLTIPVLRFKTPSKPTVKGLCESMLQKLGDPKFSSGTEQTKTMRLQALIQNTGTRMIMIDEFQHFYDKSSHKIMHHVSDWLKIMVDDCRVALVVSGLPSCLAVIRQNEQLDGRFLAPIFMPRFDWRIPSHREEFQGIVDAFHMALAEHFDLPAFSDEDMSFRIYCGTGGLIGYLAKFLRQTVWNAIDANCKTITLEDLERALDQSIWAKDGALQSANPFNRSFQVMPNEETLSRVMKLGTPVEEIVTPRRRRAKLDDPTVSEILSAS
jgi:hypothetical protein